MTERLVKNNAKSKAKVASGQRVKHRFGRWFKIYESLLDDGVVQTLDPSMFKVWVNLHVLASRLGGVVELDAISYPLHMSKADAEQAVEKLVELGLFECFRTDGKTSIIPREWFQRQSYQTSTERVRKHRQNKVNNTDVTLRNADETVSCNGSASISSYFSTVGKRSARENETLDQPLKADGELGPNVTQLHGWPTSGAKRKVGVCGTSARATDDDAGGAA